MEGGAAPGRRENNMICGIHTKSDQNWKVKVHWDHLLKIQKNNVERTLSNSEYCRNAQERHLQNVEKMRKVILFYSIHEKHHITRGGPPANISGTRSVPEPREYYPATTEYLYPARYGGYDPRPTTQIRLVLYDYHGQLEMGELQVQRGDMVTVVREDSNGWTYCYCNGSNGYVPTAYITSNF